MPQHEFQGDAKLNAQNEEQGSPDYADPIVHQRRCVHVQQMFHNPHLMPK